MVAEYMISPNCFIQRHSSWSRLMYHHLLSVPFPTLGYKLELVGRRWVEIGCLSR